MRTATARRPQPLHKRVARAARAFKREITGLGSMSATAQPIFQGASMDRLLSDFIANVMSPNDEVRSSARILRARARDLDRNNPLGSHFCDVLCDNVIGPQGFTLDAQVRNSRGDLAENTNKKIEDGWRRYGSTPVTLDGRQDLVGFQRLVLRTVAVDGEAFIRIHRGYGDWGVLFEMIDADLVDETFNRRRTQNETEVRMGIEIDAQGRRVAYHVIKDPGYMSVYQRERVAIPASDIVHIFVQKRPNQTRGITWFAPVIRTLWMEGEYQYTELVSSRVASAKGLVYEKKDDDGSGIDPEEEQDNPDDTGTNQSAGGGFREELEPGIAWKIPAGWTAKVLDPQHPVGAFMDFIKTIGRRIATGFNTAYNILTGDLEGVSFSSIRQGTIAERDHWKSLHSFWEFAFFGPLYPIWMHAALLTGQLQLASRDFRQYLAAEHIGRGYEWVDPKNDIESRVLALRFGLTSRKRVLAELGMDRARVFEELAAEAEDAKRLGITIDAPIAGVNALSQTGDQAAQDPGGNAGGAGRSRIGHVPGSPRFSFPPDEDEAVPTNGNHAA